MANIKQIVKGVLIAFLVTLILLVIFSAILTYTNVKEDVINPVIIVITVISILIGSSIVNMKIKRNGIANGGLIGGTYILILYITSSVINWNFGLNLQSVIMIVLGILFGIIGGIIGVNRK